MSDFFFSYFLKFVIIMKAVICAIIKGLGAKLCADFYPSRELIVFTQHLWV